MWWKNCLVAKIKQENVHADDEPIISPPHQQRLHCGNQNSLAHAS